MKKTGLLILLLIITISVTGQVNGRIEENNGKQVLTVWGTHAERGYAHGYLAGHGLKDIFDNYIVNYLCQGSWQAYQNLRNFFLAYYSIEPKYRSEAEALIRGMRDNGISLGNQIIGRDIDADDVLICTALPDLSQTSKGLEKMKLGCSSISSWGSSTQEDSALAGQLIITRLMDWDNHFALCRNHLLIVQIPAEEDEQRWISLAFSGFLGSLSGINESGIGAFMNVGNKTEFNTDSLFYPILFTLRNGIEMRDYNQDLSSDTDDILDAVRHRNRSAAAIIHTVVNLGNESDPMIIECNNIKGVITRNLTNNAVVQGKNLLATNHFRLLYTPESCNRYSGVADSLQNNVNISPDRSWTILTDAAGVSWNLHGIQYNESARELKWATATASTPAYLQNLTAFNLDDLFYSETGVVESFSTTVQKFRLAQNYPNPFNPTTTFKYDITKESKVRLLLYDINGRLVKTLVNQKHNAGHHTIQLDASAWPSCVYIYRIQVSDPANSGADGFSAVKKCILMK